MGEKLEVLSGNIEITVHGNICISEENKRLIRGWLGEMHDTTNDNGHAWLKAAYVDCFDFPYEIHRWVRWVHRRAMVRKIGGFEWKHFRNSHFHLSTILGLCGVVPSVRGKGGPLWVRIVFNCFNFYSINIVYCTLKREQLILAYGVLASILYQTNNFLFETIDVNFCTKLSVS